MYTNVQKQRVKTPKQIKFGTSLYNVYVTYELSERKWKHNQLCCRDVFYEGYTTDKHMKLAEQNLFKSKGLGGRTGTVASVVYFRPWGPWFETWPGSRSLRPCASHIYPLFSTG